MEQIDIWRAADLLMKEYGYAAPDEASRRISALSRAGDSEGQLVWASILAAVAVLRRQRPREGEKVH